MSLTNEQIIEAIGQKTVLEIVELIKAMEETFGVTAAAAVAAAAAGRERCASALRVIRRPFRSEGDRSSGAPATRIRSPSRPAPLPI